MANYSLVIGSKFQPFSFERYLQPLQIYGQAYKEQEDALADLATKSSIWDGLTEGSDKAHATYQAYAKALEDEASRLATEGLNPTSRRAMLNMRSRYARDITPIENAWKRREEQIAEQRKAGNSMIYDYDAATTSLDKFLDNPSLSYRSIDRKDLRNRSEVAFSKFKEQLRDGLSGFGYDKARKLDKFHNTLIKNYGLSPEQASDFINAVQSGRLSETDAALRAVYNSMYQGTGVDSWGNDAAKQAVMNTILEGVTAGIGKMDANMVEDKGAIMAQQLRNQQALIDYQQQQQEAQRLKMYDVNPTTYYSASEIAAKNEMVSKELDKWRSAGYFTKDGKLTNKGYEALQYKAPTKSSPRFDRHGRDISTYSGGRGNYEFYQWATQHGVTDPSSRQTVNILNKYYSDTRGAISSGQLATGSANFQVYRQTLRSAGDRQIVAEKVLAALGDEGKIYRAGQLRNGEISKGDEVSASEFAEKVSTNPVLYTINSPTTGSPVQLPDGTTVRNGQQLIELTNGEKYLLPAGILGTDTQSDLDASNRLVQRAGSIPEAAVNLNRANAYLGSILTTTTGTEIKPNDGTVTVTW